VERDFRKWENGGEEYCHDMGKGVKILVHRNCVWGRYRLNIHNICFKRPYVDTFSRTDIFRVRKVFLTLAE
jgi:hypothetical protein